MPTKCLWFAILAVPAVGAFFVGSHRPAASLTQADLQVAVGACEAHGSLQAVKCERQSTSCGNPPCAQTSWSGACVGVNAPKPEGSGSQHHKEVQCTNTYSSGPCIDGTAARPCVADTATATGLTCGDKIGSDSC